MKWKIERISTKIIKIKTFQTPIDFYLNMLYNICKGSDIMKFKKLLFVSDKNELPYYLKEYENITEILVINLFENPQKIRKDIFNKVKNTKYDLIVAEQENAFYARLHTGNFRLLVNPILTPTTEQEELNEFYINAMCEGQNEYENIAWFTDKLNRNITLYNDMYYSEHCIIEERIDLNDNRLISILTSTNV